MTKRRKSKAPPVRVAVIAPTVNITVNNNCISPSQPRLVPVTVMLSRMTYERMRLAALMTADSLSGAVRQAVLKALAS